MIDSCFHLKKNNLKYIRLISNKIKSFKIKKALCYFDNQKNIKDRKRFFENCNKFSNLIPVTYLRYSNNINKEITSIVRSKYIFVKIHPRLLNIRFSNEKFYRTVFKLISKTKLKILWCTFDGWEKSPNEINQIDFLAKLINLIPKNKIILLHGGGPNLLKYYEKFRFVKNVYLDLSYTMIHYQNTSLKNDMIFLLNRFDKRLLLGSDYPTFSLKNYIECFQSMLKKTKLNKIKVKNLTSLNLDKIIND